MRIFSAGLCLVLAACGGTPTGERPVGEAIACALDGAAGFESECTLERSGDQLIVHRPDGGFRRFAVTGGAVAALDGADAADIARDADGTLEIAVEGDRYRIPADAPRP